MDEGPHVFAELAAGLWRRLRDVILVAERIETFSFAEEAASAPEPMGAAEARALAMDFVVRALHEVGDPDGWRLLARIVDSPEGASIGELADILDRPRLATVERVNALVQAGLVQRALDVDKALATVAGEALAGFVREVAERLGDEAVRFRREGRASRDGGSDDGLSVL
jgi:predicted transcriptional regulator